MEPSSGSTLGRLRSAGVGLILFVASPSLAVAAEAAKQAEWWKVVAGVLAIPAAVLGLVYSYILIQKTRLESRKT